MCLQFTIQLSIFSYTNYMKLNYKCIKRYTHTHSRTDSSPEEPKMHKNSWRAGLCPRHTGEAYSIPANHIAGGRAVSSMSKNQKALSFRPCLAPAMLISF